MAPADDPKSGYTVNRLRRLGREVLRLCSAAASRASTKQPAAGTDFRPLRTEDQPADVLELCMATWANVVPLNEPNPDVQQIP